MATILEARTAAVRIDADPAVLETAAAQDVALAVWQRRMPAHLAERIAAIRLDEVDDIERIIEAPLQSAALAATLVAGGYEPDAAMALSLDIVDLADRLSTVAGSTRLKLRLEVVETDACRRFHSDYMTLRLLTTYRGAGTQWHPVDHPNVIEALNAGEVAIFKGRVLLDPPTILHRSPPIEARGEQRLLLVLDPVLGD